MTIPATDLSPRRRRSREKRLERIVAAALTIVDEENLGALTMGKLANAVDLTPGALYRYFASKDALIVELQVRIIDRISAQFDEQRAAWRPCLPPDPPRAALCELVAIADFYLALARRDTRAFRLIAVTLAEPRHLVNDADAQRIASPLVDLLIKISTLFQRAEDLRVLGDGLALERTIVFWIALHSMITAGKLNRLDGAENWFAPQRLATALIRALLIGWGATPHAVDAAMDWSSTRKDTT